ncbi:MAG TPA: PEP-CTERM sorting domain-containing protein [Tepidisphaeraceae bacterium]|jgi:hypothetical protein|nr:PEP-CTERM sorting domain-containing protein [Tepidisphaeraceae bacterium]
MPVRIRIAFLGALLSTILCPFGAAPPACAVIVLGGRDANGNLNSSGRNLNPAPSNLSSYVGTWGSYLATPIAPRYFITANHIGDGGGGGTFIYSDGTSTPSIYTASLAAVQNDLAIWQISTADPSFTHYAPLYTASTETGNALITIGRGTARGGPVTSPTTMQQAGWFWGSGDGLTSWGANTVLSVAPVSSPPAGFGGNFVRFAFNNNGNPDTGILSVGDSGGPTFVFNPTDNQYELAGINALVDQVSSQADSSTNPQFLMQAALYDSRGFYTGPTQVQGSSPVPLNSYASSIASAIPFVDSVIAPEPSVLALLGLSSAWLLVRRR